MSYLGLNQKRAKAVSDQLNQLLANYHVYYQNLRNFHWNVTGPHFFNLHIQFEEMYNDAIEKIDGIAERVRTLRNRPMSNFSEYLEISDVKEAGNIEDPGKMVSTLLENHSVLINHLREAIQVAENNNDEGTSDFLATSLGDLEKVSWMLDAWLQKSGEKHTTLA